MIFRTENEDSKTLSEEALFEQAMQKQGVISLEKKKSAFSSVSKQEELEDIKLPKIRKIQERFPSPVSSKKTNLRKKKKEIRLRRKPDAQLDLHGKTQEEAEQAVFRFLITARKHGYSQVLVITGKGYHSEDGKSVLKERIGKWLQKSSIIQDFQTAPSFLGGSGAFLIFL